MKITLHITRKTSRFTFFKLFVNHEIVGSHKVRNESFEEYCDIMEPDRIYDPKLLGNKTKV